MVLVGTCDMPLSGMGRVCIMARPRVRAFGGLGFLGALLCCAAVQADIELIGKASLPGDAHDRSGFQGRYVNAQGDSIPADQLGSWGSSIEYSGHGNRYYVANDRGFGDGTSRSEDRFHVLEIQADPKAKALSLRLLETHPLVNEKGDPFIGLSAPSPLRFDPESVRVGQGGTLFMSDEYGPYIYQFDTKGRRIKVWNVPTKFNVAHPSGDEDEEIKSNTLGRVSNKGMEGLAITPDHSTLFGMMQSPLIQDGGRKGVNVRIVRIDLADGATREYVYTLGSPKTAASEILAVDGHRFLVLEREGKGGKDAAFKKLFLVDTNGATDVSAIGTTASNGLPLDSLPTGVKAVSKRLFLDLLESKFGLAGADFPTKIEGLAWGPDLQDGRRVLIVTTDNDMLPGQPSWVWAFAVDRADLAEQP